MRGENVTKGYFNAAEETAKAFEDGWFHTGDIGEIGPGGELFIRGRKKEMIVTPEGLNVFPEDVERVLNQIAGVRDSAVVGPIGGKNACTPCWSSNRAPMSTRSSATANATLDDQQRSGARSCGPRPSCRARKARGSSSARRFREWVVSGGKDVVAPRSGDPIAALLAKYSGRADLSPSTTIEELGLSSLERVELMVALEDAFHTHLDEGAFAGARDLNDLRAGCRAGAGAATRRPSRSTSPPGIDRGRLARSATPASRRGSCRSAACSRGCASTDASISTGFAVR